MMRMRRRTMRLVVVVTTVSLLAVLFQHTTTLSTILQVEIEDGVTQNEEVEEETGQSHKRPQERSQQHQQRQRLVHNNNNNIVVLGGENKNSLTVSSSSSSLSSSSLMFSTRQRIHQDWIACRWNNKNMMIQYHFEKDETIQLSQEQEHQSTKTTKKMFQQWSRFCDCQEEDDDDDHHPHPQSQWNDTSTTSSSSRRRNNYGCPKQWKVPQLPTTALTVIMENENNNDGQRQQQRQRKYSKRNMNRNNPLQSKQPNNDFNNINNLLYRYHPQQDNDPSSSSSSSSSYYPDISMIGPEYYTLVYEYDIPPISSPMGLQQQQQQQQFDSDDDDYETTLYQDSITTHQRRILKTIKKEKKYDDIYRNWTHHHGPTRSVQQHQQQQEQQTIQTLLFKRGGIAITRQTLRLSGINYKLTVYCSHRINRKCNELLFADSTTGITTSPPPPEGMFHRRYYDVTTTSSSTVRTTNYNNKKYPLPPRSTTTSSSTSTISLKIEPPPYVGQPILNQQGGNHELAKNGVISQYLLGWDWCQPMKDRSTGFLGSIVLHTTGPIAILDPTIQTTSLNNCSTTTTTTSSTSPTTTTSTPTTTITLTTCQNIQLRLKVRLECVVTTGTKAQTHNTKDSDDDSFSCDHTNNMVQLKVIASWGETWNISGIQLNPSVAAEATTTTTNDNGDDTDSSSSSSSITDISIPLSVQYPERVRLWWPHGVLGDVTTTPVHVYDFQFQVYYYNHNESIPTKEEMTVHHHLVNGDNDGDESDNKIKDDYQDEEHHHENDELPVQDGKDESTRSQNDIKDPDSTRTSTTRLLLSDVQTILVGIRSIDTYLDKTLQGQIFRVNGERIYLVGGNWITTDQANRYSADKDRYCNELQLHQQAGLNLIRVWGGGISEQDDFYDCATQLGILVWQEFWMTGDNNGRWAGKYTWPIDHDQYLANVEDTVLRLRRHTSLLFYTGCNECLAPRVRNDTTMNPPRDIDDGIRRAIAHHDDPHRFYISSSMGGANRADPFPDDPVLFNNRSFSLAYADGPYGLQYTTTFFQRNPGLHYKVNDSIKIGFQPEIGGASAPTYRGLLRFMTEQQANTGVPRRGVMKDTDVGPAWQHFKYSPWTTDDYDHVYAYIPNDIHQVNASEWCAAAQLAAHVQYQNLFAGFTSNMFQYTTAVVLWKSQSPWPSLRGFLYDWYLESTGTLRGIQSALGQSISIAFDPTVWRLRLVNRRVTAIIGKTTQWEDTNNPDDTLFRAGARFTWFHLNGTMVASGEHWVVPEEEEEGGGESSFVLVPPMSAMLLNGTLVWPNDCSEACFLRLEAILPVTNDNAIAVDGDATWTSGNNHPRSRGSSSTTWHWLTYPQTQYAHDNHTAGADYSALGESRTRQAARAILDIQHCAIVSEESSFSSPLLLKIDLKISIPSDSAEVFFYPSFALFYNNSNRGDRNDSEESENSSDLDMMEPILPVFEHHHQGVVANNVVLLPGQQEFRTLTSRSRTVSDVIMKTSSRNNKTAPITVVLSSWNGPMIRQEVICSLEMKNNY